MVVMSVIFWSWSRASGGASNATLTKIVTDFESGLKQKDDKLIRDGGAKILDYDYGDNWNCGQGRTSSVRNRGYSPPPPKGSRTEKDQRREREEGSGSTRGEGSGAAGNSYRSRSDYRSNQTRTQETEPRYGSGSRTNKEPRPEKREPRRSRDRSAERTEEQNVFRRVYPR